VADSVIYTAATVLLSARLCLDDRYLDGINEDWSRALDYLKSISSKSVSADRCLKLLEIMESQLRSILFYNPPLILETSLQTVSPALTPEVVPDPPLQPTNSRFDPLISSTTFGTSPAVNGTSAGGNLDMQALLWSNLPWDCKLMDGLLMDEIDDGAETVWDAIFRAR